MLKVIAKWRNEMINENPEPPNNSFAADYEQLAEGTILNPDVLKQLRTLLSKNDQVDIKIQIISQGNQSLKRFSLWMYGRVNINNGKIEPSGRLPYIQGLNNVDSIADFWRKNPVHSFTEWPQYMEYAAAMFTAATGVSLSDPQALIIPDRGDNPAQHVIDNLEFLIQYQKIPALLASLCSGLKGPVETESYTPYEMLHASLRHLGQMSSDTPLSASQREALHYLLKLPDGEILAVTPDLKEDKTPLIHSIIASLWVDAALKEYDPPIITITSDRDESLRDITAGFEALFEPENDFNNRWLPAPVKNLCFWLGDKTGSKLGNSDFIQTAEQYFLEHFEQHYGFLPDSIAAALEFLHEQLKLTSALAEQPILLHLDVLDNLKQLSDATGISPISIDRAPDKSVAEYINERYAKHREQQEKAEALYNDHQNCEREHQRLLKAYQEICEHISQTQSGFLKNLFGGKPKFDLAKYVTQNRLAKYFPDLSHESLQTGAFNLERAARQLWDSIQNLDQEILVEQKESLNLKSQIEQTKQYLQRYKASLMAWQEEFPNLVNNPNWENSIDTQYRHEALLIAMHYWEAKWVITTQEYLATVNQRATDHRGLLETRARFSRYAMLMPGIVVNLFDLPGYFNYKSPAHTPLINYIDLLIVDNADRIKLSQASSAFALAKRALIIGDVARENSQNSCMAIAQNACQYQTKHWQTNGLNRKEF